MGDTQKKRQGGISNPVGDEHPGRPRPMPDLGGVWQWQAERATRLPGLSGAEVGVLAAWSLGMVVSRSCALTAVSQWWATSTGQAPGIVRQRLRAWS